MTILFLRLMLLLPGVFALLPTEYSSLVTYHLPFHPLHVSTTDLAYNPQDKRLEVICTIFTDDFESVLSAQYHIKADLSKKELHAQMDQWVQKYISSHVQVDANGQPLRFSYVGFEKASESVNVYIESNSIATSKKIDARISLLYDLYDDQMNIVHMTVNGTRKSTRLNFPDKAVTQSW